MLNSLKLNLSVRGLITVDIFISRRLLDKGGGSGWPDTGNYVVKGQKVGLKVIGRVAEKTLYDGRVIDIKIKAGY